LHSTSTVQPDIFRDPSAPRVAPSRRTAQWAEIADASDLSFKVELEIGKERRILKVDERLIRKSIELDRAGQFPSTPSGSDEVVVFGDKFPARWTLWVSRQIYVEARRVWIAASQLVSKTFRLGHPGGLWLTYLGAEREPVAVVAVSASWIANL
jgi:hypothetical protein